MCIRTRIETRTHGGMVVCVCVREREIERERERVCVYTLVLKRTHTHTGRHGRVGENGVCERECVCV